MCKPDRVWMCMTLCGTRQHRRFATGSDQAVPGRHTHRRIREQRILRNEGTYLEGHEFRDDVSALGAHVKEVKSEFDGIRLEEGRGRERWG